MASTATAAPVKPLLRGVFHQVSFFIAVVAGGVLVFNAPNLRAQLAAAVYAVSLSMMLGISALYHRPTWSERARLRMRRADHSAIFVLIAGTYTPMASAMASPFARTMLTVAWTAAVLGVLRAIFWVNAPKVLVAVLALAMGWLVVFYLPQLDAGAGRPTMVWLVIGGLIYSAGALTYAFKRPDPWPAVFGYHEVFHALVVVAAVCHYVAVRLALPNIAG